MEEEKVLLIFAANPFLNSSLRFDYEINEISSIFDKKRIACPLEVVHNMATTWTDLQCNMAKYKPLIVHFVGHSDKTGIVLESSNSEYDIGCNEDLLRLMRLYSNNTKCIFLNSCDSYVTAQILSQEIEYAIGIEGQIYDMPAREFAITFYNTISFGNRIEIEFAFNNALVSYMRYKSMNIMDSNSCPHLYKQGLEVNQVYNEGKISYSRLPSFSMHYVEREDDFSAITQAWDDQNINVFVLEAWGGVGKTTLVSRWRTEFVNDEIKCRGINVFDWSFHRQGISDNKPYTSEDFMDYALKWFQINCSEECSPSEKGELLATAVRKSKALFILDGLESVQMADENLDGMIMDEAVRAFICSLAEYNPGLCIITTRKHIIELNKYEGMTCRTHILQNFDYEHSKALLIMMKVYGTEIDYKQIYEDYKGHPLSISLLGTYVRDNLNGRLDASEFRLYDEDKVTGKYAYRIMKYYDALYKSGCQLELLRVLSLFDRAVQYPELCALLDKPDVIDLTDKLPKVLSPEWGAVLRQLKNAQLIMEYGVGREIFLDVHPLVREYYSEQLQREHRSSFIEGNRYLSDYYVSLAEDTLDENKRTNYYFRAIIHGCKAGAYQEMYQKIYLPFIKHYEIAHDARRLGGYGTNLDAISGFFKIKWTELYGDESDEVKADLFAEAAYALMCLGENKKAIIPLEKAIEIEHRLKDYKKLATYYGNLSEAYLLSGEINMAFGLSICGIGTAEMSNEVGRHNWAQMTKCANVLNQMGRKDAAQSLFNKAELLQRKYDTNAHNLYGILAYKSYDVTLSYLEDVLIYKRLGLEAKAHVDINISVLETDIDSAIKHDQNSGNILHLGAVYLSSVRLKLIQYIVLSIGNFEEVNKIMSLAMQYSNRGGRREFVIYALLTYSKCYGVFHDEPKAEEYLRAAKELAVHYNFALANIDIDIESILLKLQFGHYGAALSIFDKISSNEILKKYGKRSRAVNIISDILKCGYPLAKTIE